MAELVSVIIPTYQGSEVIQRAVNSVLQQTYANIEIIVVDDNGLGTAQQIETAEAMSAFHNLDCVKYLCHKENINGSAARNTGVRNSSGVYIALLDDDDEYLPDKISRQVSTLSKQPSSCGAAYCSHETFFDGKKVGEEHALKDGFILYEYMTHKVEIASTALLIKKSVYEELGGFDESFRRHQDWEFISRLLCRYSIVSDDFYGFNRHLVFRNSAKNPFVLKERREFYLKKMESVLQTLPVKQQKEIILHERIDISLAFLKCGDYKSFIKELIKSKPGLTGFLLLFDRFISFIRKGGKLVQ